MVSINWEWLLYFPSWKENNMPLFKYQKGLHCLLLEEVLEVQIPQKGPTWLYSMAWVVPTVAGPEPLDQVARNVPSWRARLAPPIVLKGKSVSAHISGQGTQCHPRPPTLNPSAMRPRQGLSFALSLVKVWSQQSPSQASHKDLPYSASCPGRTGAG